MNLTKYQKQIIIIILFFIIIRIPVLFIQINSSLIENIGQGFEAGLLFYCDFDKFPLGIFWQEHAFPPGTFIYLLIMQYFFNNLVLIVFEFVNMILIYWIVSRYYGKNSALNCMILIAFFPISIMNTGYSIDPIQITLTFVLLGIIFIIKEKPIFSSISLAIGTLIIYIPAILLVPVILFYYKNNKYKIVDIVKYITMFFITIILVCLPFLLLCPEKFISNILFSLNDPHSINFLNSDEFILTPILNSTLFEIQVFSITIAIKTLNIFQVCSLIVVIYFLYKKFQFKDERDIIVTSIILFSFIMILTFYLHFRFIYWIFMLSLIIFSYHSKNIFKMNKIIIFSLLFFSISLLGSIFSYQGSVFENSIIYIATGVIFVLLLTMIFLIFGFFIEKENKLHLLISGISIQILCYFSYSLLLEIDLLEISIIAFNIALLIVLIIEIECLLLYIIKPLRNASKRGKIVSLISTD